MQEAPRMVFAFSRFMFDKEEGSFPGDSMVKKKIYPPVQETWVWSLSQEDPLEKEMATSSSILAWGIPWTDEPGGLQTKDSVMT